MTYLDDDLDDLMDDEESDYDDDELYSETIDESEYKEDLIERIKDIIEYYGFEFEESTSVIISSLFGKVNGIIPHSPNITDKNIFFCLSCTTKQKRCAAAQRF